MRPKDLAVARVRLLLVANADGTYDLISRDGVQLLASLPYHHAVRARDAFVSGQWSDYADIAYRYSDPRTTPDPA